MDFNKKIVEKLKNLRLTKGLKQSCVADSLNISCSTYQKIESGDSATWAKYLNNLMEVFETTPKEFFSDIGYVGVHHDELKENIIGYLEKYLEALHQEKYETYEKLLASKEEQIALLKKLLEEK